MLRQSSSAARNGHDAGRNSVSSRLRDNGLAQDSVEHVDRNVCSAGLILYEMLPRKG
jgi:hypothetical protein